METVKKNASSSSSSRAVNTDFDKKLTKRLRNREYVKKSTERKKAYYERLEAENKKLKSIIANADLIQKQQSMPANKTIVFPQSNECDTINFSEVYKCWFNVHNDHISRLRNAMLTNQPESELYPIIITVFDHLKSQFLLKEFASKDDVLNLLYGTWMTPAELCVMWLGGFRPSDIVNLLIVHLHLNPEENQFLIKLKNDTLKNETDLSTQFTQIQSNISTRFVGNSFRHTADDMYVNNYMTQMHISMRNLRVMEEIMQKADRLRSLTLDKIHGRLIKKQFAMALLAINAYFNRITALSYMWISRPKS